MTQNNLFTKQKQTHRLRERTYGYQSIILSFGKLELGTGTETVEGSEELSCTVVFLTDSVSMGRWVSEPHGS